MKTDYGYTEEYQGYFIIGEVKGTLKIIDQDDGSWGSSGYSYEEGNGGGYSVTFG